MAMHGESPFRYSSVWSRLIVCLAVVNVVWYTIGGRITDFLEVGILSTFRAWPLAVYEEVPWPYDLALVYVLCLIPALLRIERPLWLIAWNLALGAAYAGLYTLALLGAHRVLPLAAPLFGLACSAAAMGVMSWSEERGRRRRLLDTEEAKQRFTDMLVHDLKGRVSSIGLSLSLLEKELGASDKARTLFDALHATTTRMLLQINALLDIRRMQEGRLVLQPQRWSLASLVNEALHEHAAMADLCRVAVEGPGVGMDNALVDVDPELFRRVLANLVWNALRHAPRGSAVDVGLHREGRSVTLSIGNGGAAIPLAEQAELFRPFVSFPHGGSRDGVSGSGLGLAFCKLAVEAHGGAIALQSPRRPEGDGVRISLTLPVAVP